MNGFLSVFVIYFSIFGTLIVFFGYFSLLEAVLSINLLVLYLELPELTLFSDFWTTF